MRQTGTQKKLGRPRSTPMELPIYDSMQACSAATGIPLSIQKQAKAAGSDAFRSNRVSLGPLLRWIFTERDNKRRVDWGQEFEEWRAKREKIKHDKDAKLVADKAETTFAIAKIQAAMFSILERLKSEMPPLLKGLNETGIHQRLGEKLDDLRNDLASKYAEFEKT